MARPRWQPVMMVLDKRLECKCGALAVFVSGKLESQDEDEEEKYNVLNDVDVWCQACFEKAQEED